MAGRKLRANAVTYAEQEEHEEYNPDSRRYVNSYLTDYHTYYQGSGHRTEREGFILQLSHPEVKPDGKKNRDYRIISQDIENMLFCGPACFFFDQAAEIIGRKTQLRCTPLDIGYSL